MDAAYARQVIEDELKACERAKGVEVLLAVESGSRCWGFESPDSDYDVRFVYARPKEDYLRLESVRDTIEWRMDDDIDMVGWDLSKFLRLMRASNPSVFEWLGSPIVYREAHRFHKVRMMSYECFDPVASAHHYYGMAKKHDARYIRNGNVTPKRYLYVVRSTLACIWSTERQIPVPMAFEDLKDATLDEEMVPVVDELVRTKREGLEKESCERNPELEAWVESWLGECESAMRNMRHRKQVPWEELDELFRELL